MNKSIRELNELMTQIRRTGKCPYCEIPVEQIHLDTYQCVWCAIRWDGTGPKEEPLTSGEHWLRDAIAREPRWAIDREGIRQEGYGEP